MTTFLRLLEAAADEKGSALQRAAEGWRSGADPGEIFRVEPSSFDQVPGAPIAYWVSDRVRGLFSKLPPFESGARTVKQGLGTRDDFRFLRCWWEVPAELTGTQWFPFAKGGSYSPFFSDIDLVVRWAAGGRELYCFNGIPLGGAGAPMRNANSYFKPGLTWPRRTTSGFSPRPFPAGSIFGDKGPVATGTTDLAYLALMNSAPFAGLVALQLAAATAAARSYEVGVVKRTPVPMIAPGEAVLLTASAKSAWLVKWSGSRDVQTAHTFTAPALLQGPGLTLGSRSESRAAHLTRVAADLARLQSEIDDIAFELYGIEGEDRRQMEEGFGSLGSSEEEADPDAEGEDADEGEGTDPVALTEGLLEWTLGVALGRFDVRLATGEREPPQHPDPFDPLPACSPGMLQGEDGIPASAPPDGYPLALPPHGILVDDPGHPWDAVSRVEAVLDLVAGEQAPGWIQEADNTLGRDLRDWFRRHGFERHLKRYSKSRRKAPLFWHLAPKSRDYGIWLYSPVATRDTLYRILNDYVDPKLKGSERRLLELRQDASESPTTQQRRELTTQESLVEELRAFRDEVARVAPLWTPHRDDGVVLNCAALWRLFDHHRTWQKECKQKWGELAKGKYDWAGWAMHLWPERVVGVCGKNRSIAIAHGLEEALWVEGEDGKWAPRADAKEQVSRLIDERRSAALEAALDEFTRANL